MLAAAAEEPTKDQLVLEDRTADSAALAAADEAQTGQVTELGNRVLQTQVVVAVAVDRHRQMQEQLQ